MAKAATPPAKGSRASEVRPRAVVRSAKVIPPMQGKALPAPPAEDEEELTLRPLCQGRCGHCTVHPCQLHAPV